MADSLIIALAQLNYTVGDLEGNRKKILTAHKEAEKQNADLVVFSEMAITGYPAEDLVLRHHFQEEVMNCIESLAGSTIDGPAMLVGGLYREGQHVFNTAFLLENDKISKMVHKFDLPNYGVFDEKRLFSHGPTPSVIELKGVKLGVMICEDMWNLEHCKLLKEQGAELLVVLNASPYELDKHELRFSLAQKNVKSTSLPLIYVNQVGGQDELVFEGDSFILSNNNQLVVRCPQWKETVIPTYWTKHKKTWNCKDGDVIHSEGKYASIFHATALGLKDYVEKNHFPSVVLGMSGGIDSALTAAIAVDALGPERVHLVMMPSEYTSKESIIDATECAALLGVELDVIDIRKMVKQVSNALKAQFKGMPLDTTEENIQSRLRATVLMALSNKFGYMLLSTGNKSEMAVGYATLYGDMCGGFNVLKDIYKTTVYKVAKWRNQQELVIPENIIEKLPSAELRHNQADQDNLPPYDVLDDILLKLIELRQSTSDIVNSGHDQKTVKEVAKMVKIAEYKRRQAPPGVKITGLAFGRDRRYPITNGFDF